MRAWRLGFIFLLIWIIPHTSTVYAEDSVKINTIGGEFEIAEINGMNLLVKLNSQEVYKINDGEYGMGMVEAFFPGVNGDEDVIIMSEHQGGNCFPPILRVIGIYDDSSYQMLGELEFWFYRITKGYVEGSGDVIEIAECDELGQVLSRWKYVQGFLTETDDDPFQLQSEALTAETLAGYVSQYPNQVLAQVEGVEDTLKEILGDQCDAFKTAFGVQMPVAIQDGFLVLKGCESHNCGDHFADVYIDLNSLDVYAAVFTREGPDIVNELYYKKDVDVNQDVFGLINQTRAEHAE